MGQDVRRVAGSETARRLQPVRAQAVGADLDHSAGRSAAEAALVVTDAERHLMPDDMKPRMMYFWAAR